MIFAERFVFDQLKPESLLIPLSPLISYQFLYSSFIIISIILIIIDKCRKIKICNKNTFIETLIFNKPEEVIYGIKSDDYFLFVNIFLLVSVDLFNEIIFEFQCTMFNYWMFEVLFYVLFYSKFLKTKMYKHHKFSLIFILSSGSLLKTTEIIMHFVVGTDSALFFDDKKWLIPVGFIAYFILNTIEPYIFYYEKYYLDKRIISITSYLLIYGIFGLILSSICAVLSSYIPCGDDSLPELFKNICSFKDNNGYYYFDSFSMYFEELSSKDLSLRIFLLILMFSSIYVSYYYIYAIYKVLNPIYHFFMFRLNELIFTFLTLINYLINSDGINGIDFALIIVDIFLLIFYLLGSMVYLELIELNFYDLNKYTRRSIKGRANDDIKILLSDLRYGSEIIDEE